jgi:predicted alpha/beta superfamily hydrolase
VKSRLFSSRLSGGTLEVLALSSHHGPPRRVRVWVPDDARPGCPAVYLQDGQNVFSRGGDERYRPWHVDEALADLIARRAVEPPVVVGIDHLGEGRISEYAPFRDPSLPFGAGALGYEAFLCGEVVPFVERAYGTGGNRASRFIGGSSMGGLVSLWIAARQHEGFAGVAAFSPTAMWARYAVLDVIPPAHECRLRLYVDAGSHEVLDIGGAHFDYGGAARRVGSHLRRLGFDDDRLRVVLDPHGGHDEGSWARRFPGAMAWLLDARR